MKTFLISVAVKLAAVAMAVAIATGETALPAVTEPNTNVETANETVGVYETYAPTDGENSPAEIIIQEGVETAENGVGTQDSPYSKLSPDIGEDSYILNTNAYGVLSFSIMDCFSTEGIPEKGDIKFMDAEGEELGVDVFIRKTTVNGPAVSASEMLDKWDVIENVSVIDIGSPKYRLLDELKGQYVIRFYKAGMYTMLISAEGYFPREVSICCIGSGVISWEQLKKNFQEGVEEGLKGCASKEQMQEWLELFCSEDWVSYVREYTNMDVETMGAVLEAEINNLEQLTNIDWDNFWRIVESTEAYKEDPDIQAIELVSSFLFMDLDAPPLTAWAGATIANSLFILLPETLSLKVGSIALKSSKAMADLASKEGKVLSAQTRAAIDTAEATAKTARDAEGYERAAEEYLKSLDRVENSVVKEWINSNAKYLQLAARMSTSTGERVKIIFSDEIVNVIKLDLAGLSAENGNAAKIEMLVPDDSTQTKVINAHKKNITVLQSQEYRIQEFRFLLRTKSETTTLGQIYNQYGPYAAWDYLPSDIASDAEFMAVFTDANTLVKNSKDFLKDYGNVSVSYEFGDNVWLNAKQSLMKKFSKATGSSNSILQPYFEQNHKVAKAAFYAEFVNGKYASGIKDLLVQRTYVDDKTVNTVAQETLDFAKRIYYCGLTEYRFSKLMEGFEDIQKSGNSQKLLDFLRRADMQDEFYSVKDTIDQSLISGSFSAVEREWMKDLAELCKRVESRADSFYASFSGSKKYFDLERIRDRGAQFGDALDELRNFLDATYAKKKYVIRSDEEYVLDRLVSGQQMIDVRNYTGFSSELTALVPKIESITGQKGYTGCLSEVATALNDKNLLNRASDMIDEIGKLYTASPQESCFYEYGVAENHFMPNGSTKYVSDRVQTTLRGVYEAVNSIPGTAERINDKALLETPTDLDFYSPEALINAYKELVEQFTLKGNKISQFVTQGVGSNQPTFCFSRTGMDKYIANNLGTPIKNGTKTSLDIAADLKNIVGDFMHDKEGNLVRKLTSLASGYTTQKLSWTSVKSILSQNCSNDPYVMASIDLVDEARNIVREINIEQLSLCKFELSTMIAETDVMVGTKLVEAGLHAENAINATGSSGQSQMAKIVSGIGIGIVLYKLSENLNEANASSPSYDKIINAAIAMKVRFRDAEMDIPDKEVIFLNRKIEVTGQAVDKDTDKPVKDADVCIYSFSRVPSESMVRYETVTDGEGKFVIEVPATDFGDIPLGYMTATVGIMAEGYHETSTPAGYSFDVNDVNNTSIDLGVFELYSKPFEQPTRIFVTDTEGKRVEGADVSLSSTMLSSSFSFKTDAEGQTTTLFLYEGKYELNVSATGYKKCDTEFSVESGNTNVMTITVILKKQDDPGQDDDEDPRNSGGGDNSGGNEDPGNSGGDDNPGGNEEPGTPDDDDNPGGNDDPGNPGGQGDPGNQGGNDDPQNQGGQDDEHENETTTGNIDGLIVDAESGSPLKGAKVILKRNKDSMAVSVVYTDEKGSYLIRNVEEGPYIVTAEKDGYESGTVNVTAVRNATEAADTIKLKPQCAMSGRITDSDGNGIAGAEIVLEPTGGDGGDSRKTVNVKTDSDGHYSAEIRHGKYTAEVLADGYRTVTRTIEADGREKTADFVLERKEFTVRFTLQNSDGNIGKNKEVSVCFGPDGKTVKASSDENGLVSLTYETGEYKLSIYYDNSSSKQANRIYTGEVCCDVDGGIVNLGTIRIPLKSHLSIRNVIGSYSKTKYTEYTATVYDSDGEEVCQGTAGLKEYYDSRGRKREHIVGFGADLNPGTYKVCMRETEGKYKDLHFSWCETITIEEGEDYVIERADVEECCNITLVAYASVPVTIVLYSDDGTEIGRQTVIPNEDGKDKYVDKDSVFDNVVFGIYWAVLETAEDDYVPIYSNIIRRDHMEKQLDNGKYAFGITVEGPKQYDVGSVHKLEKHKLIIKDYYTGEGVNNLVFSCNDPELQYLLDGVENGDNGIYELILPHGSRGILPSVIYYCNDIYSGKIEFGYNMDATRYISVKAKTSAKTRIADETVPAPEQAVSDDEPAPAQAAPVTEENPNGGDAYEPMDPTVRTDLANFGGTLKFWPLAPEYGKDSVTVKQSDGNGEAIKRLEFLLPAIAEVYAADDGTVVYSGYTLKDGNGILIDLGNGTYLEYTGLSLRNVKEGDEIDEGERIGLTGKSGENGSTFFLGILLSDTGWENGLYICPVPCLFPEGYAVE